jgi:hypothetical protein
MSMATGAVALQTAENPKLAVTRVKERPGFPIRNNVRERNFKTTSRF